MFRKVLSYFTLPLLLFLSNSSGNSAPRAERSVSGNFNPGPDAIAGEMADLIMWGSAGSQRGLATGITTCNAGNAFIDFFAMPNTHHPVAAQNLYRMSSGAGNNDRFEQIGQSWVKHTFGAKQANSCFLCQPGGNFTHLGVGCSDTYASFQSTNQPDLGSRAWINPFTGIFPTTARNHTGHAETDMSHLTLVESDDLNEAMNPGATYYAELLYVTPDEYAWCQTHPGECNMYNNASYQQYSVFGTSVFSFSPVGSAMRMTPAINAWTGATINPIEPEPGIDGRAFIAWKVTGPVAGVWHYEYALYNMNLDRAIQSFSVPLGGLITVSNLGFHAPLNHPGFPNDGTQGDAGFSNAVWTSSQTATTLSWSSETFAQNQNANAIRWGTLYNFRFDSNRPPAAANATIGFFKTGAPVVVAIEGPDATNATPTPAPTPTPATPTPTPSPTATPTPTPPPIAAQTINLSTRMRVQTGDNVGIGGFIISGTQPKTVLIRGIGPSLPLSGALADPVIEVHASAGELVATNDNWNDALTRQQIIDSGLAPINNLESALWGIISPGIYTVVVRGKDGATGIGLFEVYDLSQAVPAKLANISTRALVNTGDGIVIAGFILGNHTGSTRIVVRGIGPSLTAFGIPNALADPTLELRDNNGALLVANNNWQDNPAQAAELTAAGLAPTNPLESGIAATLPPGAYTALLAGLNNGTGVGVVEMYDRASP
jgi:hypothetical protein